VPSGSYGVDIVSVFVVRGPAAATPSAEDRQNAFLTADADRKTVAPDRVQAPASSNILQAGAVIAVAMIIGIRSDFPAQITAQVTENVYGGRDHVAAQGRGSLRRDRGSES
jgi:type IV secretory pathway VirB10-like protein